MIKFFNRRFIESEQELKRNGNQEIVSEERKKMGAKFSIIKWKREKEGRERFESVRSGYIHHSPALQNDLGD